jgi:hypothetical protein
MRGKLSLSTIVVPTLLGLALTPCVCAGAQPVGSPVQEHPKMTSTIHENLQPGTHTLAEYPQFTPQEMGQRTLALIDSLKSFDELSLERIRKVTGFPMEHTPPGRSYVFEIYLPQSNWHYLFEYWEDEVTKENGGIMRFYNTSDDADMTPVCLDYNTYISQLEKMGFRKGRIEYHQLGWIAAIYYTRGNVSIQAVARREVNQSETKPKHECIYSLGISALGR